MTAPAGLAGATVTPLASHPGYAARFRFAAMAGAVVADARAALGLDEEQFCSWLVSAVGWAPPMPGVIGHWEAGRCAAPGDIVMAALSVTGAAL